MIDETNHVSFSRSRLENLSTGELLKLAEFSGLDIPAGLERIFLIEELLENFNSVQELKEELEINPSWSEAVPLPKQYNISYIDVIIRDPLWVLAYWEIKSHDREIHENTKDFKGYFLRIIALNKDETVPVSSEFNENSFLLLIDSGDSARYLGFTEQSAQSAGRYIVKLGAIRGNHEWQLAVSQPFVLPRLVEDDSVLSPDQNPLVRLSGVHEFTALKSTNHQSRNKRL